jgi:hypothetical protein
MRRKPLQPATPSGGPDAGPRLRGRRGHPAAGQNAAEDGALPRKAGVSLDWPPLRLGRDGYYGSGA